MDESIKRSTAYIQEYIRRGLEGYVKRDPTPQALEAMKGTIVSMLDIGLKSISEEKVEDWGVEALSDPENKDNIRITITPKSLLARMVVANMIDRMNGVEKRPNIIFEFEITEEDMEKNGNTFTPGARVQMPQKPGEKNAAPPRTGVVTGDVTDDGKMKVAWDEGGESFEDPGTLRNKT